MNGWTAPEDDVDLLRGELKALRGELLVLRQELRAEKAGNRALVLHLEQRAELIAAKNAEIQRLEQEVRSARQ